MSKVLSLLLAVLIPFQAHATVWFDNIHADTMNFERRDESSAATVNALDSSKTYVKLTGTVTTINGITAPSSPYSRFILISNQTGAEVTFNHQNASAAAADRLVLTNAEPLEVPNGGSATFMYDHGQSRWVTAGGGGGNASGVSLVRDIAQTAHGFAACDVIRHNGTSYVKAQADSEGNAEVYGIVTEVQDANNFTVTTHGYASCFSGLTAGTYYFLSASTAGAYTVTAPTTVGHVVKPIFFALSATEGNLGIYRGNVVSAAMDASEVTYDPTTDADWPSVPDDVAEALDTAMGAIVSHEDAATGAHAATAISVSPTGNLLADDVQEALEELQGDLDNLSSETLTKDIAQTAHGLSVGDWVYFNGTSYTKAQADEDANSEVYGVVSAVADANNFTITTHGYVTGLSGLTAGAAHFLSADTAGAITATEPTTSGTISKPVLLADSTTSGYVMIMRGVENGGSSASAVTASASGTSTGGASADAVIIFPTEQWDTNGAYNTTTGKFTVPSGQGGYYTVCAYVDASTVNRRIRIYRNGTAHVSIGYTDAQGQASGCGVIDASAGDELYIAPSGGVGAFGSSGRISFMKEGT